MTNNKRFNQLLNSCQNPRAVYNALLALGKVGLFDQALSCNAFVAPKSDSAVRFEADQIALGFGPPHAKSQEPRILVNPTTLSFLKSASAYEFGLPREIPKRFGI